MAYLQSPEIASALIHGGAVIIASLIAAASAFFISKRFLHRNTLEQKYLTALADIDFLLVVEKTHCEAKKRESGVSPKNRVRAEVLSQGNQRWSGRFNRSRVRSEMEQIEYHRNVRTNTER